MSNDNGLEPGWLSRQMESVQREERNRAIAEAWTRMLNERQPMNPYLATEEYLRRHGAVTIPAPDAATVRSFEVELRSDSPRIMPSGEFMYAHFNQVEPQDNRCMDTVARSMTNEARHFDVRHVNDIPFGEYEFSYRREVVRFTISCRTIVDEERLARVVWDGTPCLGIIRMARPGRSSSITLYCRYGQVTMGANAIKIISQQADSPPQPASHVRRVEL